MPAFEKTPKAYTNLADKVCVLTGGANGIGMCLVKALFSAGAHVYFGDIDEAACQSVVDDLKKTIQSSSDLVFRKLDVRIYQDNLDLFQIAYKTHGRVDHAFSVAGVTETKGVNWFDSEMDLTAVTQQPSTHIVDINLTGALYFARIASVFLRQGNEDRSHDKSICILGSVASFKEQAGLFIYQPTKHGVLGLIRSSRKYFRDCLGIRLNTVCPSLTRTRMAGPVIHLWESQGVAPNEPEDVSDYCMTLASVAQSPYGGDLSGIAVFVEGGKGWEIEKDLDTCDSSWIGEEMSKNAAKIEAVLGNGSSWVTPQ